jgi:hypothetical protein
MKYDRTHPIWEQACVAAMAALSGNGELMSELSAKGGVQVAEFPRLLGRVTVSYADALIAEMNKAIEQQPVIEEEAAK